MLAHKSLTNDERAAIETQQTELEGLGASANNRAFLVNPDDGVRYNLFVDVWRWASRYFKRKHGNTHR
ncbi:MAG: hypothetical protein WBG23_14285 [Acidobacteriaceae bacterium]|jgi:hypothetical protein